MQEWPDTLQVTYQYNAPARRVLTYEMRLWAPYKYLGDTEGAAVFGDKGHIVFGNERWRAYGPDGKEIASGEGSNHEADHVENFLECVKSRRKPNADLETVGHPSSVLCHAGNIAWRVRRTVKLDPKTDTFADPEANKLLTRPEYRQPGCCRRCSNERRNQLSVSPSEMAVRRDGGRCWCRGVGGGPGLKLVQGGSGWASAAIALPTAPGPCRS